MKSFFTRYPVKLGMTNQGDVISPVLFVMQECGRYQSVLLSVVAYAN
jgi:hypothetical protein